MVDAFLPQLCWLLMILDAAAGPLPRRHLIPSQSSGGFVNPRGVRPLELWCAARNNANDTALEGALNWACSAGGIDCRPIMSGGNCYDGAAIQDRATYAFNSYFLSHNLSEESCNFSGTAAITSINPSFGGCKLPSSFTLKSGNSGVPLTGSGSRTGTGVVSYDISSCGRVAGRHGWASMPSLLLIPTALNIY